jgi:hypothetical protein
MNEQPALPPSILTHHSKTGPSSPSPTFFRAYSLEDELLKPLQKAHMAASSAPLPEIEKGTKVRWDQKGPVSKPECRDTVLR